MKCCPCTAPTASRRRQRLTGLTRRFVHSRGRRYLQRGVTMHGETCTGRFVQSGGSTAGSWTSLEKPMKRKGSFVHAQLSLNDRSPCQFMLSDTPHALSPLYLPRRNAEQQYCLPRLVRSRTNNTSCHEPGVMSAFGCKFTYTTQ